MNRGLTKEDVWTARKCRCLASLAHRKIHIKAIVRYYYIPMRVAKIKGAENTKC